MSLTLDLCPSDSPRAAVDSLARSSQRLLLPSLRLAAPALSHAGCLRIWVVVKRVSVHVEVGREPPASPPAPLFPFQIQRHASPAPPILDPPLNPAAQTFQPLD